MSDDLAIVERIQDDPQAVKDFAEKVDDPLKSALERLIEEHSNE